MSTPAGFDPFLSTTAGSSSQSPSLVNPDYTTLRQAWVSEKRSPELLPYEARSVENLMKALRAQWRLINARQAQWAGRDSYIRDILIMEADRIGYILKSYLRIRLWKIQMYARHYLLTAPQLLSPSETAFANNMLAINEEAFTSMFLRHLPQGDEYFQTLTSSDDPGGDMIRRPQIDRGVFVKAVESVGAIDIGNNETAALEKDKSYMIRYDLIREYIKDGRVVLI